MDLNDIWQEHKVWILGCFAGIVAFLIANTMISNRYDLTKFQREISSAQTQIRKQKWYTSAQRTRANEERQKVDEQLAKVEAKTYFRPREAFDLDGKPNHTVYYMQAISDAKGRVQDAMDEASIDFSAQGLGLPSLSPVEREETQLYLVGVDLIDDAVARLLAASNEVKNHNPGAHGLRSLERIQIDVAKKAKQPSGYAGRSQKPEIDLGQRVSVQLRFRADGVTLQWFLERLIAGGGRPLLVEEIEAKNTGEAGDPLEVKCKLLALIKPEQPGSST